MDRLAEGLSDLELASDESHRSSWESRRKSVTDFNLKYFSFFERFLLISGHLKMGRTMNRQLLDLVPAFPRKYGHESPC